MRLPVIAPLKEKNKRKYKKNRKTFGAYYKKVIYLHREI